VSGRAADALDLAALERRLGHRFADRGLLERALTHRSYAYERREGIPEDYERLEFLGDALLGFLVSEWLWRDDPSASEGTLTRRKQSVVRAGALTEVARTLGMGQAMRLGRGEEGSGGRSKSSLLADVFEAVLGAVFLDGGIRAARAFVRRQLAASLAATRSAQQVLDDYKTLLQERVQATLRVTPRYRVVRTEGPAHAHEFEVEVVVDGRVLGSGLGSSRKQAEQRAARGALEAMTGSASAEA
jgi:ribonuclease-3